MMGDRYFLSIKCPECGHEDGDVYYAPTCGFTEWKCKCGYVVDLEAHTGISFEDASNKDEMQSAINKLNE